MPKSSQESDRVRYVHIDENRCNGCVLCMKACPTKAIRVENGAPEFSRKMLDDLAGSVIEIGAKGLAWIKITEDGWQSSLSSWPSSF